MRKQMSDDLLIKYLLAQSSPEEAREVEAWAAISSDNARKLEDFKIILDTSSRLAELSPVDETEAWERFNVKREIAKKTQTRIVPIRPYANLLRIAAVFFLLAGGAWMATYWYSNKNSGVASWVTLSADKHVRVETLPDGSVVHINKNSALSYAADFNVQRQVKLKGEAFFEVKHNDALTFTVKVEDVTIRDVGTAFNVKSRQHNTEVIVESGIVKISKNKEEVQLGAQQMVRTQAGHSTIKVERNVDQLYNYYRSKTFTASNTPLWRLIDVLNEAYDTDISIENSALRNTPITVKLRLQDSLGSILELIRLTTPDMQVQKTGNTYILKSRKP